MLYLYMLRCNSYLPFALFVFSMFNVCFSVKCLFHLLFCMTISILKCFDDKQKFLFVSTTEAAESKAKVIRPIAYSGTKVVLRSPDRCVL